MMEPVVCMELQEELEVVECGKENELCRKVKMQIEERIRGNRYESVEVCQGQRSCKELNCFEGKEMILGNVASEEQPCSEVAKKANVSNFCCKDELIVRVENELRSVQDKLNLKNEQFNRLEEANEKLRKEFQLSKLEWEKERLVVHGKISSLQSSFDSHMRFSDCLQTKLKMCNQALAHEESRRKLLEIQLSETHALFENIYAKCQDERANIDKVNHQKDDKIANLEYCLATKDIMFKDMEYENLELKQQKENLHRSLNEFLEAEIKFTANFQTLTKLQKKFEELEQVHDSCSTNLELKEMEWNSQLESLKAEANEYLSELNNKETEICDLRNELEMCQFSLQSLKEEFDVVVLVLKSEYSEAYSKLLCEHENNQNQILILEKGLEASKNMLDKSQRMQKQLEEYVQEVETLNKTEMAERDYERNLINAELQKWKHDAENLKLSLEEAREIQKRTEAQLQLQVDNEQAFIKEIEGLKNGVKELERNNDALLQQITSLETALVVKDDKLEALELENKSYNGIMEELESKNYSLSDKITGLLNDWQNIFGEMEGASNQLHEICCQDESLLAAFKITEYASIEREQKLYNELGRSNGRNEAILFSPTSKNLPIETNDRLPLQEIYY